MKLNRNKIFQRLIISGIMGLILLLGTLTGYTIESDSQPRYVVITTSAIAQNVTLDNFLKEKQRLGFVTEVITEGTWGGGTGNTAADRLRSWLKANYQTKNIKYVLLIGNPDPAVGDVPMKICCPYRRVTNGSVDQRLVPTDYYYADLAGTTWDLNGDGNIGVCPADFGPTGCDNEYDVIVGRIPCYNADYTSTRNALNAIINYTQTGSDTSWRKTVLLPVDNYSVYNGFQMGEAIKDAILIPEGYGASDYARVYDYASVSPEYSPCTSTNVLTAWNAKHPGLVVWGSQGTPFSATDVFDNTQAPQLNPSYPAFVFGATSNIGYPQVPDNLGYSLLKNGSVGAIVPSYSVNWYFIYQPTDFAGQLGACQSVAYNFTRRFISGKQPVGNALYNVWRDIDDRNDLSWYNHLVFNLYGDPSLSLSPKYNAFDGGSTHTLALTSNGKVYAWGYNYYGQLGNGTTNDSSSPVAVSNLPQISAISCGMYHNVALSSTGTIWAWGNNSNGQVGGTNSKQSTPLQVSIAGSFTAVSAGSGHSLALKNDGTVWAWGYNIYGQLGNGTTTSSSTPVQVSGLSGVTAIAAGSYHSVALKSDGTVWVWGNNSSGQLGNGTTVNYATSPVKATLTNATKIRVKGGFTLALRKDGTVRAWGMNNLGQLGNGTTTNQSTPVTVSNLTNVVDIQAGSEFSMALKSGGKVYAWGGNLDGQCGQAPTTPYFLTPTRIPEFDDVLRIGCGWSYGMAQHSDFTVFSWGNNYKGQLGDFTYIGKYIPGEVEKWPNCKLVSGGFSHSNFILYDKSVWGCGMNMSGQLGDGTNTGRNYPVLAKGVKNAISISCGNNFTMALTKTGEVYTWGYNNDGELGAGDTTNRNTPFKLGLTNIVAIATGNYHALALKNDGTVYAWGSNDFGQLGQGTAKLLSPTAIGFTDVAAISAGGSQSMALKKDGTVWTWGWNDYGQLGDGTKTAHTTPAKIAISDVAAITMGFESGMALKRDGTVWSWGKNSYGELGTGDITEHLTPVQIPNFTGIRQIAAGHGHSMALKTDGTVWTWGNGDYGQLGNGGNNLTAPTALTTNNSIRYTAIGAANIHSLGIRSDETIWAWGYNFDGAIGDRSNTMKQFPTATSLHCWGLNSSDLPDLTASSFVSPGTAVRGEVIASKVSLEVQNVGSGPASSSTGSFQVGIYLSTDNRWDSSDTLLTGGNYTVATPLAPGDFRTVATGSTLQIPTSIATGYYYLVVAVDSADNVAEYKTYNNFWTANVIQIQ